MVIILFTHYIFISWEPRKLELHLASEHLDQPLKSEFYLKKEKMKTVFDLNFAKFPKKMYYLTFVDLWKCICGFAQLWYTYNSFCNMSQHFFFTFAQDTQTCQQKHCQLTSTLWSDSFNRIHVSVALMCC
jgi:uncharacterized protein with NAD-binding domain and iron-sulfur cluster